MRGRGRRGEWIPSWAGHGEIEINSRRGERTTVGDAVVAILVCLAVDLVAWGTALFLTQRAHRTVCGRLCFDNPRAHIHDDVVLLCAFGIAGLGLIALSLIIRRSRVPVVLVQAIIAGFVLVNTWPDLRTAQHRQHILQDCGYAYVSPCQGVPALVPPAALTPAG